MCASRYQNMSEKLVAIKGMNDILPPDSARWEWLEERVRSLMARYAYRNIRTPIVEPTPLFVRGLGEVTDIVEKDDRLRTIVEFTPPPLLRASFDTDQSAPRSRGGNS